MGRSPCCTKEGLNKGAWTAQEDEILRDYIKVHGEGKWRDVPRRAGLKRCGKSCRLRWLNYLRPDIKRGNFSNDEEDLIIRLHKLLGNRWSLIAGRLPGRTDNEIKNYWNTRIAKKAQERQSNQSKIEKKFTMKPQSSDKALPESRDNGLGCNNILGPPAQQDIECSKIACMDGTCGDIPCSLTSGADDMVIDFNINMGKISFPEMVDFDFPMLNDFDISDLSNTVYCKGKEGSPILDQQLMLENSRVSEECVQADIMGSDFRFLASFLESSSEEWLGDA
ncbi:hypothetical protein F0562_003047 [Nyssa sinensis]|uniref:Myb-related protein 123 n=1 Tax=Nyssa sinensis TaxID=561372 RepID=A0A5J5BUB8_9ASTE|nr:hypothetical protein F0562_003047 [Nyssa sinensis]